MKKFFIVFCSLLLMSLIVVLPVSAATEEYLLDEITPEEFYEVLSRPTYSSSVQNLSLTEDSVTFESKSNVQMSSTLFGIRFDSSFTYHIHLEGSSTYYRGLLLYVRKTASDGITTIQGGDYVGPICDLYIQIYGTSSGYSNVINNFKRFIVYEVPDVPTVPEPSGSPDDIKYAADLSSDILSGLWQQITDNWLLAAFVCVPLASGILFLLVRIIKGLSFVSKFGSNIFRNHKRKINSVSDNEFFDFKNHKPSNYNSRVLEIDGIQYLRLYKSKSFKFPRTNKDKKIKKRSK